MRETLLCLPGQPEEQGTGVAKSMGTLLSALKSAESEYLFANSGIDSMLCRFLIFEAKRQSFESSRSQAWSRMGTLRKECSALCLCAGL